MNRNHLWKLFLIVFVVAWSAFEIYPPNGRSILDVFQEEGSRRDATFTNILQRAQELQKENPNRSLFADLKDAVGTNEIARYFPFDVKGEKNPTSVVLFSLQLEAAGRIKLGLDFQRGSSALALQVAPSSSVVTTTKKLSQPGKRATPGSFLLQAVEDNAGGVLLAFDIE